MARSSTLYDQLTCSVCLERYKDPRTLPCHHSFCRVCLERVPAEQESGRELGITCPVCRKSVPLPSSGGVSELPAAFLINNLLEIQKTATTYVNVQPQLASQTVCDKHERVLEFYCNDCEVLLCSVCSIKFHRAHDCDLASDVAKVNRKLIEDQIALLRREVTQVDMMLAHINRADDRVISEGSETRRAITDTVEQLHRHIEEGKTKLMTMLDKNIQEKLLVLKTHREKCLSTITQMRKSESVIEDRLDKLKDSIEIMAVKDELMKLVSEVRLNEESIKFSAPNKISFSSNPSPINEIGFLFEPADQDTKEVVAGKMCRYMLYLPETETDPVCHALHLVSSDHKFKPSQCKVGFSGEGKYEVSFTPSQVGSHELVLFPFSPSKKATVAQLRVNSQFLQENRRQVSKQIVGKPTAMTISRNGELLIVCETSSNCVTFHASNDGEKLSSITSLGGSKKKSLNKPCSVGVTPDNCIIVIDSGKQCYRLLKIQMNGKLIATAEKVNFQSPNALAVHPSGEICIVDSDAHSLFIYNADLTFSRTFGGKGKECGYFDQPHSIAFDSAGSAYISDSMNNRIQKLFKSEKEFSVLQFGSGNGSERSHLTRPTALCISCYDTIFVTDEHKRIAAFDTLGCFLGEVQYSKISLANPCAMVISNDESHMCVLDSYNEALYILK